jgi:23S rRNA pseudouridine1911/1915/1917 synthase
MVLLADSEERLDRFLARVLPAHSRSKLVRLIGEGEVRVDGKVQKPSFQLAPGMSVELPEPEETPPHDLTPFDMELNVAFEDEHMLVVDKPRGLAVHPASSLKEPSLVNALLARPHSLSSGSEEFRPGIVHRLDKDTTGLLLIAKTDAVHAALAKKIEAREVERRYVAVVAGMPEQERFRIEAPIIRDRTNRQRMAVDAHGKPAITHVSRLKRLDQGTLLAVRLETGRTHQIRVHLRAVGHPVLGDDLYAPREFAQGPLQLHAAHIVFTHPVTGERVELFAPPPEDFLGAEWVREEDVQSA